MDFRMTTIHGRETGQTCTKVPNRASPVTAPGSGRLHHTDCDREVRGPVFFPPSTRPGDYSTPMFHHTLNATLGLVVSFVGLSTFGAAAEFAPERFEARVQVYEAADRDSPPPPGAIMFAGDSQFFRWKTLREDLPGYTVVNRGVDGFHTSDLVAFAERLVLPHRPRLIVLHVGGNDVHNGKIPQQILGDLQAFVTKVRAKLPDVPIIYSSITPGPGRWDEAPQRKATNKTIQAWIATQPNMKFVDLWDAMLTPEGQPREDLWVEDRVHPNHAAYLIRVKLTLPLLGPPDRPGK